MEIILILSPSLANASGKTLSKDKSSVDLSDTGSINLMLSILFFYIFLKPNLNHSTICKADGDSPLRLDDADGNQAVDAGEHYDCKIRPILPYGEFAYVHDSDAKKQRQGNTDQGEPSVPDYIKS